MRATPRKSRAIAFAHLPHRCDDCGTDGDAHNPLEAHHIDRDERNDDPANFQILCRRCHRRRHRTPRRRPNPDQWVTTTDVAAELGIHINTARKYVRTGTIPGVRFGDKWLVPRAQWEAFRAGTWRPGPSPRPVDLITRKVG